MTQPTGRSNPGERTVVRHTHTVRIDGRVRLSCLFQHQNRLINLGVLACFYVMPLVPDTREDDSVLDPANAASFRASHVIDPIVPGINRNR